MLSALARAWHRDWVGVSLALAQHGPAQPRSRGPGSHTPWPSLAEMMLTHTLPSRQAGSLP